MRHAHRTPPRPAAPEDEATTAGESIVLVVRHPLLLEGAKVGDRIVIQPGSVHPVLLVRPLPVNYARQLLYLEQGATEDEWSRSPGEVLSRLASLASAAPPPPQTEGRRRASLPWAAR